jgi:hypothetical protein
MVNLGVVPVTVADERCPDGCCGFFVARPAKAGREGFVGVSEVAARAAVLALGSTLKAAGFTGVLREAKAK